MTGKKNGKQFRLSLYVLLGLLVVLLVGFVYITRMFFIPVLLALTFTTLFFPVYAWLYDHVGQRSNLAAFLMVLIMLFCLIIPSYFLIEMVARQASNLINSARPLVDKVLEQGDEGLLESFRQWSVIRWINLEDIDWEKQLQRSAEGISQAITFIVKQTTSGMINLVTGVFVMLYTMFFFFRDGEKILDRIRYLSPLKREYEEMIIKRFTLISRATVKGTLLIGLIQGSLGGVALLVFGIETWLLWTLVMVILSVIPLVGPWLVMIPASVFMIAVGDVWQGIVMLGWNFIVISNSDNLIRPRLVGHDAHMHDLLIFFSTLGGLAVFGIMGFIAGPVIAAMFIAVLNIYSAEFQNQLEDHQE